MPDEQYPHIFIGDAPSTHEYTSPRGGGSRPRVQDRDREEHSARLTQRLEQAWTTGEGLAQRDTVPDERQGVDIEFEGAPGFDLPLERLESRSQGIQLRHVRTEGKGGSKQVRATVYVPRGKRGHFLQKIQEYAEHETPKLGNPRHQGLINNIEDIRHADLPSFCRPNEFDDLPGDEPAWVEVWLRRSQENTNVQIDPFFEQMAVTRAEGALTFPEREVRLIHATRTDLERLVKASDDIAEFRPAREVATLYVEQENQEQAHQVADLLRRLDFVGDRDVAVCILDKGVNNGHPLINRVLDDGDLHTVDSSWGTTDDPAKPHGTLMAGAAAYGDLLSLLDGSSRADVSHRLESAKIIPPSPDGNPKGLWGHLTWRGLSLAEIGAPQRKRVICLAITAPETRDRGRPSSWSAALDAAASGYWDDRRRLVVVSAGNTNPAGWLSYPESNYTDEVQDPGQAWNALTVGAYTENTTITDPYMAGWTAVAPAEALSPFSTTSTTWPAGKWPIKPEVVMEGGNVAKGPNASVLDHEDLALVSTFHDPAEAHFGAFRGTSVSAALAARMAAQIQVQYPDAWPETVRALIVHSAEWTQAMKEQLGVHEEITKTGSGKLLRVVGYGVPDLGRALYCASNSLTLVSEAVLQPFARRSGRPVTQDMHLYELPWPRDILASLAETPVQMRVTLSYFVEPGPGEVGWDGRYRYSSHGLRFDVNGPLESEEVFRARVNKQAREAGQSYRSGPQDHWVIGSQARDVGLIHSDIWEGSAAELAESNKVAIYPVVGWWRERAHLNRWDRQARYSLVVSIHTPEERGDVDIYVPVAEQVGTTVRVEVPAGGSPTRSA